MTVDNFVRKKVAMWVDCVKTLSKAPTKSPKLLILLSPNPFSVKGHTCSESCTIVEVLLSHCKIFKAFYPALFEEDLSDAECKLFSLPTHFAGLGIKILQKQHHCSTTILPRAEAIVNLALLLT